MVLKIFPREKICSKTHLYWHLIHNIEIIFHWSLLQSSNSILLEPRVWIEIKCISLPFNLNYVKNISFDFLNFFLKWVFIGPSATKFSLREEINNFLLRDSSCFKISLEIFSKEYTSSSPSSLILMTIMKWLNLEERIWRMMIIIKWSSI